MRLVGLLSWYEESPGWLAETVCSLARAGVDHVVAVDGAYFLFPDAAGWSGAEQHEAVIHAARGCGIGCTVHVPQEPWLGNEVEKRNALFALGEVVAGDDGWLWVIDADEIVTDAPGLHARLETVAVDVVEVLLWERFDAHSRRPQEEAMAREVAVPERSQQPVRRLFRAGLGITVVGNHFTYVTADGRTLWGSGPLEDAESLLEVKMEHRARWRTMSRTTHRNTYNQRRTDLGVEA